MCQEQECTKCGSLFTPPDPIMGKRRTKCDRCRPGDRSGEDQTCKNCGQAFRAKRFQQFCSRRCRARHKNRRRKGRDMSVYDPGPQAQDLCPVAECPVCKTTFKARSGCGKAKNKRQVYCSKSCASVAGRSPDKRAPFCKVTLKNCITCGDLFVTRNPNRMCCSEVCNKARTSVHDGARRKCKVCGGSFRYSGLGVPRTYCSDACSETARKAYPRKHRQRARLFGVAYEPVNPMRVFSRDGWRCQICGKPTPKERRGTLRSNAPELDHRIPISRGGPHTYDNVQCACRQCNASKANRSEVGQMPLLSVA